MRAEEFSRNILDLDDKMRFAGIMEKSGHLHARCKKEGCEEYLKVKDQGISFSQIANIIEMRKPFSSDLGDLKYIVYTYDKVKIFSIPLMDYRNLRFKEISQHFLFVFVYNVRRWI